MFDDIINSCTTPTPGGGVIVYGAEAHDVLAIPDVDVVGGYEITDPITFKTGKKWTIVETVVDTATLTAEGTGDVGFKSSLDTLKFSVKGIDQVRDKLYNASMGCGMIWLFYDLDAQKYRLVGSLQRPSNSAKSMYDYGAKAGDKKRYDFEFQASRPGAALWYSGTIALTPAT